MIDKNIYTYSLIFLAISYCLIYLNFKKIEKIINIYDIPDKKRKFHKKKTLIFGGIFIFFHFLFLIFLALINKLDYFGVQNFERTLTSLSIMFFPLFCISLYDDIFNVNAWKKIIFSSIFVFAAVFIDENLVIKILRFSFIDKVFYLNNYAIFFSAFCFLIFIQALNMFDGVNLQSLTFFLCLFLYIFFKTDFKFFALVIILSILFLYILNYKNMIFMGDSGIYTLSLLSGYLIIIDYNNFNNFLYADTIFLLLMLPGIDLVRVFFYRVFKGCNPLKPDRQHIHHLILKKYNFSYTVIILKLMILLPYFFNYLQLNTILNIIINLLLYFQVLYIVKK